MSDNLNTPSKRKAKQITSSTWFNVFILALIVLNGFLIGVQTYNDAPDYIKIIQLSILFVFFIEVALRWHGRTSTKEYWADRWNIFDIVILLMGVVPEIASLIFPEMDDQQNAIFATLRVLRIVQLTRSIRAIDELRELIGVLIKSIKSLSYIAVLFLLVMYIYAIMGVTLFKNASYSQSEHLERTVSNPDPYGSLGEAFFTLFRILTAEDWTDLRYNLLKNKETANTIKNVGEGQAPQEDNMTTTPNISNWVVTAYHVSWMVIAAYLLVNLVVGAIVNNFQVVLDAKRAQEEQFKFKKKHSRDETHTDEEHKPTKDRDGAPPIV